MPAARKSPPSEQSLVQELLAERRELKVALERAKLELAELKARTGGADPRLRLLEAENRRLRDELASARAERDLYREGLEEAAERLEPEVKRASP
jgi:chromosome segregation ATPase